MFTPFRSFEAVIPDGGKLCCLVVVVLPFAVLVWPVVPPSVDVSGVTVVATLPSFELFRPIFSDDTVLFPLAVAIVFVTLIVVSCPFPATLLSLDNDRTFFLSSINLASAFSLSALSSFNFRSSSLFLASSSLFLSR